jgi:hypothetical protein
VASLTIAAGPLTTTYWVAEALWVAKVLLVAKYQPSETPEADGLYGTRLPELIASRGVAEVIASFMAIFACFLAAS